MKTWAWMTGGLVLWAAHFLGVYLISSAADVASTADDVRWRMAGLTFSLVLVLAAAGLLWAALRRLQAGPDRFADQLAALAAAVSLIAITWQTLPTVVGY